jgi:ABC-type nitrate/sulfonate/bicarbonate transport system substrate-binding protein
LEKNGYTEKDVDLVNVAPADLEISLQQGDIDAGVIQESNASIIRNDLDAVCVASTDGVCESIKILSVRKGFAEEYQDYTDKVVKAFSDLDEYTIAHTDEVKELLAESNNSRVEDWASVDRYVYKGSFDNTALENAANSIKFLVENKSISNSYEASEAFDNSYYERACK